MYIRVKNNTDVNHIDNSSLFLFKLNLKTTYIMFILRLLKKKKKKCSERV